MTFPAEASGDYIFRPTGPRVLAGVLVVGAAVGVVAILVAGGLHAWPAVLPLVLVAYAAWLLFWFPKVEVGDRFVTLVNPLQTLRVPWDAIILVDTKYAMTLVTPSGRYSAWAAPAPGVVSSLRDMRRSVKAESRDTSGTRYTSVRPGDQRTSDSGAVASVVRGRLARLAEAGAIDVEATGTAKPQRVLHLLHAAVLLALLVASLTLPAVLT